MTLYKPISVNGFFLHIGDKVKLVGEVPNNPLIGYTDRMRSLLNDDNIYRIYDFTYISEGITTYVSGWNWDLRNIFKVIEGKELEIKEPALVTFDINSLFI
jgi:hypothetical protein